MAKETEKKSMGFFDIIKNLFWLLIFLQFAPLILSNLKTMVEDAFTPKTQIGQLNITGLISDSNYYVKNIQKFLQDSNIKALLLKVDSPGGFPGIAQNVFMEINKFKEKKPVVAFVENMGISGAYNIAAAANHIIASPSSLIGSIGVWLQVPPNVKHLAQDWKIKFVDIHSGEYKTAGSPFKDMTSAEQKHLQNVSDDSYDQFVKDIATSRNLSVKNQKEWAEGKVFTGNQALKLKLIDQIGSFQDAVDEIKKEAMIDGEIKLVQPKRISNLMKLFGAQDESDSEIGFSSFVATTVSEVAEKLQSNFGYIRFR